MANGSSHNARELFNTLYSEHLSPGDHRVWCAGTAERNTLMEGCRRVWKKVTEDPEPRPSRRAPSYRTVVPCAPFVPATSTDLVVWHPGKEFTLGWPLRT